MNGRRDFFRNILQKSDQPSFGGLESQINFFDGIMCSSDIDFLSRIVPYHSC